MQIFWSFQCEKSCFVFLSFVFSNSIWKYWQRTKRLKWGLSLLQYIWNFRFKNKMKRVQFMVIFFHISKMQYCIHFYNLLIMVLINWLLSCTKWKYTRLIFASSFGIYLPVIQYIVTKIKRKKKSKTTRLVGLRSTYFIETEIFLL